MIIKKNYFFFQKKIMVIIFGNHILTLLMKKILDIFLFNFEKCWDFNTIQIWYNSINAYIIIHNRVFRNHVYIYLFKRVT